MKTTVKKLNRVKNISFSGSYIQAKLVENVENYPIKSRTIVINLSRSNAYVNEAIESIILPFSSRILDGTSIKTANLLMLIEIIRVDNIGSIIFEPGWQQYSSIIGDKNIDFPKDTPLWRSQKDSLGCIVSSISEITKQSNILDNNEREFEIKANLWFAPSKTHCFIHNSHGSDLIEVHSQILGQGRMQKFKNQQFETLYEETMMSEGYTTPIPFCQYSNEQKRFAYPWHQYYSDTDCIWLAIEFNL